MKYISILMIWLFVSCGTNESANKYEDFIHDEEMYRVFYNSSGGIDTVKIYHK